MNCVNLVGRVTHDIELNATTNGIQYAQFSVAIDNGKDKDGNPRQADFINCVAWDKRAENLSVYVHKGHRVGIEGKIKTDKYQNEKGENRYKTYVLVERFEFLESKPKDNYVPQQPDYLNQNQASYTTEQIDNLPIENNPFEEQQALSFDSNDLPF